MNTVTKINNALAQFEDLQTELKTIEAESREEVKQVEIQIEKTDNTYDKLADKVTQVIEYLEGWVDKIFNKRDEKINKLESDIIDIKNAGFKANRVAKNIAKLLGE